MDVQTFLIEANNKNIMCPLLFQYQNYIIVHLKRSLNKIVLKLLNNSSLKVVSYTNTYRIQNTIGV